MPVDHSEVVKEAGLARLRGNSGVALIVGKKVYDHDPGEIQWPFIRWGMPIVGPYDASCWAGSEHTITIHAFAKGPGQKDINALSAAIVAAMEGFSSRDEAQTVDTIGMEWRGTTLIPEGKDWHAAVAFEIVTVQSGD